MQKLQCSPDCSFDALEAWLADEHRLDAALQVEWLLRSESVFLADAISGQRLTCSSFLEYLQCGGSIHLQTPATQPWTLLRQLEFRQRLFERGCITLQELFNGCAHDIESIERDVLDWIDLVQADLRDAMEDEFALLLNLLKCDIEPLTGSSLTPTYLLDRLAVVRDLFLELVTPWFSAATTECVKNLSRAIADLVTFGRAVAENEDRRGLNAAEIESLLTSGRRLTLSFIPESDIVVLRAMRQTISGWYNGLESCRSMLRSLSDNGSTLASASVDWWASFRRQLPLLPLPSSRGDGASTGGRAFADNSTSCRFQRWVTGLTGSAPTSNTTNVRSQFAVTSTA